MLANSIFLIAGRESPFRTLIDQAAMHSLLKRNLHQQTGVCTKRQIYANIFYIYFLPKLVFIYTFHVVDLSSFYFLNLFWSFINWNKLTGHQIIKILKTLINWDLMIGDDTADQSVCYSDNVCNYFLIFDECHCVRLFENKQILNLKWM